MEKKIKKSYSVRQANVIFYISRYKAADWLANFGVNIEERFKFVEAVSSDLRTVLLKDLGGVAWPRMVPAKISVRPS